MGSPARAIRERRRPENQGEQGAQERPTPSPAPGSDDVVVRPVSMDRRPFVTSLADLILADLLKSSLPDPGERG